MNLYIFLFQFFISHVLSIPTYLKTNYNIDYIKKIKPQKCFSNEECPHYSNGCYIPKVIYENKNVTKTEKGFLKDYSKNDLMKENIFGYCNYYYFCTNNKNNTIPNDNCIVYYSGYTKSLNETSYMNDFDQLFDYDLSSDFTESNIVSVNHCNKDSVKKYCNGKMDIKCSQNSDCFTNNCDKDVCLNSKDYFIYKCSPKIDYEKSIESNDIVGDTSCKKVDYEYCDNSSECISDFSHDGFCLDKVDYDAVHDIDETKRNFNIASKSIILLIIIVVIVLILLCFIISKLVECIKLKKLEREMKK